MYTELTIRNIQAEADGVKSIYFEGDNARQLAYKAGQYLTFVRKTDSGEIRRSYSITSSPALKEPLSVAVKKIENGIFSRYLTDESKAGDVLLSTGAAGFFTLPPTLLPQQSLFFFAAGSGITPIYSLIKTALHQYPAMPLVLVYSNTSPQSTIFLQELQVLQQQFSDKFYIEFIYSISPNLYRARLHKDLLKELVKKHAPTALEHTLFYLCGPEHYMRMCVYGLTQLAVPAINIRKETFTTGKVLPKLSPPDTQAWPVRVRYQGKEYPFVVQYPDSILGAARKQGLSLPYSCEVGRCGNCVARCIKGKVWMSYNEVLTDRELQQGLVLTCVGYPQGGELTLEI